MRNYLYEDFLQYNTSHFNHGERPDYEDSPEHKAWLSKYIDAMDKPKSHPKFYIHFGDNDMWRYMSLTSLAMVLQNESLPMDKALLADLFNSTLREHKCFWAASPGFNEDSAYNYMKIEAEDIWYEEDAISSIKSGKCPFNCELIVIDSLNSRCEYLPILNGLYYLVKGEAYKLIDEWAAKRYIDDGKDLEPFIEDLTRDMEGDEPVSIYSAYYTETKLLYPL